jgi:hypothetical protein
MSESALATEAPASSRSGYSGRQVAVFVLMAIVLTAGAVFWVLRTYVYAADFKPVSLSVKEQTKLDHKLQQIGLDPKELMPAATRAPDPVDASGRLIPERYAEDSSRRNIRLNERELNALVASNPELARRFAIDLTDGLASAKVLIPVDPEMPFLGGKTLRVSTGLEINYRDNKPVVILRGVSIMGVPIPNAWLGNLKHVDLVQEFGTDPGFWQGFALGIERIEIKEGELHIALKE